MDFQRNMWAEAWVQGLTARWFVLLAVVGTLALLLMMEWLQLRSSAVADFAGTIASTIIWAYLAYAVHVQVLLPHDRSSIVASAKVLGFATLSIGIAVVIGIVIALATMVLTFVGSAKYAVLYSLLVGLVLGFPLFVRLATLLPAYVAGRARGVRAANERGKEQFRWIAGRLLVGPCLLFVLSGIVYSQLAIPTPGKILFWNAEQVFLPANVFGYFLFNIVQAYVTALAAVILSRAFLRAEGMPDTSAA